MTESLDIDCAMNLLSKQATEIAQKTGTLHLVLLVYRPMCSHTSSLGTTTAAGMENARQRVHQLTVDIMRASRTGGGGGPGMPGQYGMPQQVGPLYVVCGLLSVRCDEMLPPVWVALSAFPVCGPGSMGEGVGFWGFRLLSPYLPRIGSFCDPL